MTANITAISQTALDWQADKIPLFYPTPSGDWIRAEDKNAIVRSGEGNVLGVVSDGYQVFQNSDLFDKVRPLAEEGLVNINNVGFLQKGKLVYVQAQMASEYSAVGERYQGFITLTNQHTGRARAGLGVSMVRVVCENTFAMATADLTRFAHVGEDRTEFLSSTFVTDYVTQKVIQYTEKAQRLSNYPVTPGQFQKFLLDLYQKEEMAAVRNVEKLNELFYNGTETEGKTAYDAFNAITEFNSNFSRKSQKARFDYVNFGAGSTINQRAMAILSEAAS